MADNFNLRAFLTENKLTKNAKLLSEGAERPKISTLGWKALEQSADSGIKKLLADYQASAAADYTACDNSPECRNTLNTNQAADIRSDKTINILNQLVALAGQSNIDLLQNAPPAKPEEEAKELGFWDKVKSKVGLKEGSDYGYEALIDVVDTEYDGDPAILAAVEDAFHRGDIDTSEFSDDPSAPSQAVAQIANGMDIEAAQQSMDFEEGVEGEEVPENPEDYTKQPGYVHENLTAKERRLVEMVQDALGLAREDYQNADPAAPNDSTDMAINMAKNGLPEGEKMVQKEPLPKYENIENLMKEIEHGTAKATYEYKMKRMKEIAEMLEAKVSSLEEGEHAEYTDKKAINQMRKDIAALRKGEEKLRKEFDKKFNKKEKAAAPKKEAEAEKPTLQEGTFDLRKYLVENKITSNSRLLTEETEDLDDIFYEYLSDVRQYTGVTSFETCDEDDWDKVKEYVEKDKQNFLEKHPGIQPNDLEEYIENWVDRIEDQRGYESMNQQDMGYGY